MEGGEMTAHLMTVNINTKKNETVKTLWHVWQERPYPSIGGGAFLRWENGGGIFEKYGNAARGIAKNYKAVMLRPDFDADQHSTDSRKSYAGYEGNPGLTYRGREVGEITAEIKGGRAWFTTGYNCQLTAGERALLDSQAAPALVRYVEAHTDSLYAVAVEDVKESINNTLAEMQRQLDKLTAEAAAAVMADLVGTDTPPIKLVGRMVACGETEL